MYIIYKHINKQNGKAYIGLSSMTLEARWNGHVNDAKCGSTLIFHRAIIKYGIESWDHTILEAHDSLDDAKNAEMRLIEQHKTFFLEYPEMGYNMTRGGDGTIGRHHTPEARSKIAASNSRRIVTADTKNKIRLSRLGKKRTTPITDEERHVLSQSKLGERNPNAKLTFEDVQMIRHLYVNGIQNSKLALQFNVTRSTISNIIHNKVWKQ